MIDQLAFILSPRDSGLGIYHLAWLLWMMLPVSARNKALLVTSPRMDDALQLEGPLGPLPVSVAELYATRAFYSSYSSSVEHDLPPCLWYVCSSYGFLGRIRGQRVKMPKVGGRRLGHHCPEWVSSSPSAHLAWL